MNSLRNKIVLSSLAVLAVVGGVIFYMGKTGSISADVGSKECKFYAFVDRKTYNVGQTMSIGVKNDKYSQCTLKVRNDSSPWSLIDAKGKEIYKLEVNSSITTLKPGNKTDWSWNMRDKSGSYIPAGSYQIKFNSLNKVASFTVN